MLRFDHKAGDLVQLDETSLKGEYILERADLQKMILKSWDAFCGELGLEELYLIGAEITPHESCRDRIDILALDRDGHPVVFELKRHRDKLQLLQALSYAAMVARWDAERFLQELPRAKGEATDEVRTLLEDEHFELRPPKVVLLAESYDPEVILAADWLAKFGVPIYAFAIASLKHGGDTLLSIDQRFPLVGLDDLYVSRATRKERGDVGEPTWEEVLQKIEFPFARRAVDVFRKRTDGSPRRRSFFSIYADSPLGRMRINLRRKYLTMYTVDQSPEAEEILRERLGTTIPVSRWGSEKTQNSGFTFRIETEKQFDRFLQAVEEDR